MIVGADGERDTDILRSSATLYSGYKLKRVYYSAYSPIPGSSQSLPARKPPLMREHRLYQADWLYRFYGFAMEEVMGATEDGMLDLALDPKLAWALRNRQRFPIDVNTASREELLRIPGLGVRSVDRVLDIRRLTAIRLDDLAKLTRSAKTLRAFVTARDWTPGATLDGAHLAKAVTRPATQLSLF